MKKIEGHINIQISGLKDGVYNFHFDSNAHDFELLESFSQQIITDIELHKIKQRFIVNILAYTSADFQCDRCLDQVFIPLSAKFSLLFTSDINEIKQIDEEEEVKYVGPNDHSIDITDDIRQYLLLAIPLRKICGEDENGKPLCKKELPFIIDDEKNKPDARWSALSKIDSILKEEEK